MIRVTDYKTYFESIIARISGISMVKVVAHQDQLSKWIKEVVADEIFMLAIIPSADTNAPDVDNITEPCPGLIFILKKVDVKQYDNADDLFITDIQQTQDKMTAVKQMMLDDKNNHIAPHFTHYLEIDGMHMDPEYDFLGCHGWNLSFNLKTVGF